MDLVVPRGGACGDRELPRCARKTANSGQVRIDLSEASWVDPCGLVTIAALVQRASSRGKDVEFTGPRDPSRSAYLHRMGLGEVLDSYNVDHDLRSVRHHSLGDRLLEVQHFNGDDSADDLADQVHRIFRPDDRQTAATLYASVQEIAQNVLDHSEADRGFVALQQYRGRNGLEVAFAISDGGIGPRRALRKVRPVRDDEHAIRLAVREGVTSTRRSGRGYGLHSVVKETARRAGRVRLWSGDAAGVFAGGKFVPHIVKYPASLPGTVVAVRIDARGR